MHSLDYFAELNRLPRVGRDDAPLIARGYLAAMQQRAPCLAEETDAHHDAADLFAICHEAQWGNAWAPTTPVMFDTRPPTPQPKPPAARVAPTKAQPPKGKRGPQKNPRVKRPYAKRSKHPPTQGLEWPFAAKKPN